MAAQIFFGTIAAEIVGCRPRTVNPTTFANLHIVRHKTRCANLSLAMADGYSKCYIMPIGLVRMSGSLNGSPPSNSSFAKVCWRIFIWINFILVGKQHGSCPTGPKKCMRWNGPSVKTLVLGPPSYFASVPSSSKLLICKISHRGWSSTQ